MGDRKDLPTFGKLLRRHREAAGLSRVALAARAGVSEDAIDLLERGERRGPRPDTVRLISEALRLNEHDRAKFEASAERGRASSGSQRRRTRDRSDIMPRADSHANAPRRVFLSHTSDLGKHTEPGTFVAAAFE